MKCLMFLKFVIILVHSLIHLLRPEWLVCYLERKRKREWKNLHPDMICVRVYGVFEIFTSHKLWHYSMGGLKIEWVYELFRQQLSFVCFFAFVSLGERENLNQNAFCERSLRWEHWASTIQFACLIWIKCYGYNLNLYQSVECQWYTIHA